MTYDLVRLQRVADTTRRFSVPYVFWHLQTGFPASWIHEHKIRPRWERYPWSIPRHPIEDKITFIDTATLPAKNGVVYVAPKQVSPVWDESFSRLLRGKALKARNAEDLRLQPVKAGTG